MSHKKIFATFLSSVLKGMKNSVKEGTELNWKTLGYQGVRKVANKLQVRDVIVDEEVGEFAVSCKPYEHRFTVGAKNFEYTRIGEDGKIKNQSKGFEELLDDWSKYQEQLDYFESYPEEWEWRKQEKAKQDAAVRETLARNPKSVKKKRMRKKAERRLRREQREKRSSETQAETSEPQEASEETSEASEEASEASTETSEEA